MSDMPPGAGPGQPSEEEIRAYLDQLREAPVDQVLAEVVSGLLNAAQVKLGRADGRLLIDAAAALVDSVRDRVTPQLTGQVDQALTQLRLAQVEAEREVVQDDATAEAGAAGDAASAQPPTESAGEPGQGPPPGDPGGATSRLWIPGR